MSTERDGSTETLLTAPVLPGWDHAVGGKVRELYVPAGTDPAEATEVLMVATDRISAYDHACHMAQSCWVEKR